MTFSEIGKKAKAEYPHYADLSDYEAGKAYALKYLQDDLHSIKDDAPPPARNDYQPPNINRPAPPSPGFLFPGRQADYHENQVRDVKAKTAIRIAQENAAASMEIAARATDDALRMQPKRMEEQNAITEAAHEAGLASQKLIEVQATANQQLTKKALERGLDVTTLNLVRQEEEKVKADKERAQNASAIKIKEAKELEDNRLRGYKQEVAVDIEAIRNHRLMPHATVLGISAHLQGLIVQRDNILALPGVTEDTRKHMLDTQDKLISAFEKNLDVQIQRHLLEAGEQEDVGGT